MRYSKENNEYKNDWLTFYPQWSRPALSLDLVEYDGDRPQLHFCLGWGNFFIKLPFKSKYSDRFEAPTYGIYYHERSIWIQHGIDKVYCIHLPHDKDWVRTSKLLVDGGWTHETYKNRKGLSWQDRREIYKNLEPSIWRKDFPYTYTLRSGEVQNITATVTVEEREWRWRWFKWLPYPRQISKTISVNFSEEVGEERGSWKGGTTGCGYSMLKGETAEQALRRMEKERRFER